jgi:uncharacterized membrane protein YbaN (DUF454 family)
MDPMPDTPQTGPPSAWVRSPRRVALAGLGVLAVVLGGIGVFVPGLPTTIFLIMASYCFARSCPWLEERLLRVPLFAPYMGFIDDGRPMSARARVISMTAMWTSVLLSLAWLRGSGRLSTALAATIIGVAGFGTVAVLRFRRERRPAAVVPESSSS